MRSCDAGSRRKPRATAAKHCTQPRPGSCLALEVPRAELYFRIDRRVESMFAAGWAEEVRRLRELPRPMSREASHALGYREIMEYLDGGRSLSETVGEVQLRTRQFA